MENKIKSTTEFAMERYLSWLDNTEDNDKFRKELLKIYGNHEEITEAFYTDIKFGTSGLRGILGPGTNRINEYVIRRVTQGLSNYLKKQNRNASVVIAYDSRCGSRFFAEETAAVLRGNGLKPYVFADITPVPVLSYAIKKLKCDMGIMITASHNPKRYNGYKVYNKFGYQVVGDTTVRIMREINRVDFFNGIKYRKDRGINVVDGKIEREFISAAVEGLPKGNSEMMNQLKTVYTPLNGAGRKYVRAIFKNSGYSNFEFVKVQEFPDPEFRTCPSPNPEKILTYDQAFKHMDSFGGDIIVATDPDADRVGVALYHDGMRTVVSGNQLGLLMLDYLCHIRPCRPGDIVVRSIVTTPLVYAMAKRYGFRVKTTLTGFKYIGQIISELDKQRKKDMFYFGFEESDSFLSSPFISEKDGVSTALLIVQMAAFHKSMGKDLIDRLLEIYEEFGTCIDKQRNYFFSGASGRRRMMMIMEDFRNMDTETLGGKKIARRTDYMQETGLPKTDAISFEFEDGSRIIIRPSGTEEKLKVYTFETGDFTKVERDLIRIIEKY